MTENEIVAEIEKALGFEPKLKLLVFATTANKDTKVEGFIRNKDVENRAKGLFAVDIASWEDIVDQLERYRATYNWYVNNCQFKDATDVSVSFDGYEDIVIRPEYVRTIVKYEYKELTLIELTWQSQLKDILMPNFGASIMPWNQPRKIDKKWCKLNIRIVNIGNTVIKTPKLIVFFRLEDIVRIDDDFCYCNAFGIEEAVKAQINAGRDAKREVFQTYRNQIEYRPKNSVFVQRDYRDFHISIIPADGIKALPLFWNFLCEDYHKEGFLTIYVEPKIDEQIKTVEVHDESELKPDEVSIEAKIIED